MLHYVRLAVFFLEILLDDVMLDIKLYERNSYTLRLLLLAGTNFSIFVVCCIWQVFIIAFLR